VFYKSNGNESRKILIFAALTFISLIFRYEILYAKYADLLDKLKKVKYPFFSTLCQSKRVCSSNLSDTASVFSLKVAWNVPNSIKVKVKLKVFVCAVFTNIYDNFFQFGL
jgi:nucleoside recognition membrane protein YjiH